MKFFIPIFIVLFFSSCSNKNAFDDFSMAKHQELSVSSLKRVKIVKNLKTIGAFNAIYLNEVYPDKYNIEEYFFVYIYLKENDDKLKLSLNNHLPIKIKELASKNRFTDLSSSENNWNKYYLVSFATTGKSLNLKLESDQSFSVSLTYQKDQQ